MANTATDGQPPGPMDRYWDWVAAVCYLLFTVDLLTTLFAAAVVGIGAESNPLVRTALAQGPVALVGINLIGLVCVVGLFALLRRTVSSTPAPFRPVYARVVGGWIGLLVAVGLGVFANNLAVIVYHRSLLPGL